MTTRRSGLGRGLESLIPIAEGADDFRRLRIDEVIPNPNQPRVDFDEVGLEELAGSISEVGVLQPVIVRPLDDGRYALIAGERRWRAAKRAGLDEIPAMIRRIDDQGSLTEALIENLQRQDLSPLEEAAAFRALLEDHGMTHDQVATAVGKSRPAITNTLRLLQLPAPIQGMVERGELSAGHARALLAIEDTAYAQHVAARAVAEGWSVRQVEEAARARVSPAQTGGNRVREVRPVEIVELEQRLRDRLGSKVDIRYRNQKGKVEIGFGSLEDLERIYRQFFQ
ncbi:MAG TPA: ParB/RepB/Spo0J family partition protein [Acidimicrobiia bacterium]|nr:ParB/RepB/Spo0J family partition protein [Acidimicrobiia bacterium]